MYRIPGLRISCHSGKKETMSEPRPGERRFVEVVVNGESFFIRFESEAAARAVNKHNITRLGDGVHKHAEDVPNDSQLRKVYVYVFH